MNNHRIAIWSDIEQRVLVRIEENKDRLARCRDPEILPVHRRIAADDEHRLAEARRWIAYHRS